MKINLKVITFIKLVALVLNKSWSPSYVLPPAFLYLRAKGMIIDYMA